MTAPITFYTSGADIGAIYRTLAPPPPYKYVDTAHTKKAQPTSAHTALHVAQANWRPAEDMGFNNQGILLRIAILLLRTVEKWLVKSFE